MLSDYVILAATGAIILTALIITTAIIIYKSKKVNKQIELARYRLYCEQLSSKSIEDIQLMLDNLIQECIDDYMVTHVTVDTAQYHYITDEEEIEIRKNVGSLLANRISDVMYYKLGLYYNKYTLSAIISEKIYIRITAYVVENNTRSN